MKQRIAKAFLALSLLAMALPLSGEGPGKQEAKQPPQATKTERIEFAPGGVIHVNHSYGSLTVEGWDRPEVEITVTRLMPFDFKRKQPERAAQHLDAVNITTERRLNNELTISKPTTTKGGVALDYEIHVPRNSRLVIRHGTGYVLVSGVTGDIDATCSRGDIMLWLAAGVSYSIDAKSNLGKVISDSEGSGHLRYLVGQRFANVSPAPSPKVRLRMGFGGITITRSLPESETGL
jgi:hypothetical protein